MTRRVTGWLCAAVLLTVAAGCGGNTTPLSGESVPHTHTNLPAGDGTQASYVGYTLAGVRFPTKVGVPGTLSFHIETFQGKPLTDYLLDSTKKIHVYVVSSDLAVYRHVHPTMAADGTWTGDITLPQSGAYRVITEFSPRVKGGAGNLVLLGVGESIGTPVARTPIPPPANEATTDGLTLKVITAPRTGYERQLELGISKLEQPASLGSFLGLYAHVSAFDVTSDALEHMHPLGAPVTQGKYSVLTFHTNFDQPGDYRVFVQVRVSGIVWTLPITLYVTGRPSPEL